MKFKDLPNGLRQLAELRMIQQRGGYVTDDLSGAFNYCATCEGVKFWRSINRGDFSVFYEKYGEYFISLPWMKEYKQGYDYINPSHYKGSKEVIEMMVDIWGREKVSTYCEINAFKYRMRLGKKPDQPIERDLEKARWYEDKAKELMSSRCDETDDCGQIK